MEDQNLDLYLLVELEKKRDELLQIRKELINRWWWPFGVYRKIRGIDDNIYLLTNGINELRKRLSHPEIENV